MWTSGRLTLQQLQHFWELHLVAPGVPVHWFIHLVQKHAQMHKRKVRIWTTRQQASEIADMATVGAQSMSGHWQVAVRRFCPDFRANLRSMAQFSKHSEAEIKAEWKIGHRKSGSPDSFSSGFGEAQTCPGLCSRVVRNPWVSRKEGSYADCRSKRACDIVERLHRSNLQAIRKKYSQEGFGRIAWALKRLPVAVWSPVRFVLGESQLWDFLTDDRAP